MLSILVLAAVELGGPFGVGTATVEERTDRSMVIDIEVEVAGSADSVVAHLAFGDERTRVIPLLDRGEGRFGVRTVLDPRNYQVVFEAVGRDGGVSEPVSLARLGAELTIRSNTTTTTQGGLSPDTRRLGWLALALGAASLSALAFWALGEREKPDEVSSEEE